MGLEKNQGRLILSKKGDGVIIIIYRLTHVDRFTAPTKFVLDCCSGGRDGVSLARILDRDEEYPEKDVY